MPACRLDNTPVGHLIRHRHQRIDTNRSTCFRHARNRVDAPTFAPFGYSWWGVDGIRRPVDPDRGALSTRHLCRIYVRHAITQVLP